MQRWSFAVFSGFLAVALAGLTLSGLTAQDAPKAAARTVAKKDAPAGNDYGLQQVRKINEEVRQVWKDNGLAASPPATDGEWVRRVYLDVLGRIPSYDELRGFFAMKDADRRAKLVSKLLNDEDYTEEYARNWTTIWTNILIGRTGGTEQNSMISRSGMQKYLRDSFARNKPYDKLVFELVTATGGTDPEMEKFNGAVNFLIQKVNEEDAALATASTAKIFLGLQVQCTQCHNHPFNDWKQQKFWEFNAFFRQTRAIRKGMRNERLAELMDRDYAGPNNTPQEAELFYELRNGLLKVAYPVFVDGQEVSKSGIVSENNRRQELGKLIIQSPYMDKAIVNRMWAHFLGYAFTKPMDDMGPHNPATHPALLDYLAEEFRKNSFNLKELIRWITLSEPYGLSSKITKMNEKDDPQLGESPKFSHFYMRHMQAEELFESLLVATEAHKTKASYEEQEKQKSDWLRQFSIAFGTDEGDEATTFNGTIPQALMMFNGDLIKKATSIEQGSFLHRIAFDPKMKPSEKIDYLFLSAVARKPTKDELMAANYLLTQVHAGKAEIALQDMWWAVLNSNEFIINH
jgi:hypothetical protein